ncbi:cytochrome P450 [Trematosphaeria pertusa]|uniref:Cytochrome P450 n=1 Tax=Trematosphaeria pertusa TaxID=390896 RepID=A0A6A6IA95_9PLEO|nr:cytochrome P450 [Trematosphaeria pertusa]KAF2247316.1 cytochrome P450 [Trematosphaeria pertusa]
MYLQTCAALSVAELSALKLMHGVSSTCDIVYSFLVLFCLQYLSINLYYTCIYPFFVSPLRKIPGPKDHHPLIGQTLNQFRANGPYELYLSWSRKWPAAPFIRYISFGNTETLLVNSLRAHQEVLSTKCYSFVKPPFFARIVGEVTGMGLVFAEGEEHRIQRKLLNGIFSTSNVKKLLPVVQLHGRCLTKTIDQRIGCDVSAVVEVVSLFSKATLDIIGLITLGKELDSLNAKPSFHECYDLIFNQSPLSSGLTAVNTYIPLRSWLPLEANRSFVAANNEVKRILRQQIRLRQIETATSKSATKNPSLPISRDILTYLLEAPPSPQQQWTEDELLGYLRNEIMTLPRHGDPDYTQIEGLRYLNNFCREVLRVYAPAVMIWRQAAHSVVIENTYIPAGTNVIISPQVPQFHPHIWGSSAANFEPDRWDSLSSESASPYAFQAFSSGPRVCIGKGLAMLEFKAILVEIVRKYEFEAVEGTLVLENYLTLRPRGGLRVKFKVAGEGKMKRKG